MAETPQFDIEAQVRTLGADSLLPPYTPTPGEMSALKVLANGSMTYWQWRGEQRNYRTAWYKKLLAEKLIASTTGSDGAVTLTSKGREAIARGKVR